MHLDMAYRLAQYSACRKMRFGAVLVGPTGDVLGQGYNHSVVPDLCCMRQGVKSGTMLERCGAVHAEQAALLDALSGGLDVAGATVVVAGLLPDGSVWSGDVFYCTFCARLLKEAGVGWVQLDSRIISIQEALREAYTVACAASEILEVSDGVC